MIDSDSDGEDDYGTVVVWIGGGVVDVRPNLGSRAPVGTRCDRPAGGRADRAACREAGSWLGWNGFYYMLLLMYLGTCVLYVAFTFLRFLDVGSLVIRWNNDHCGKGI